ncbi:AAA family ATPase [Billgrantia saliphila]|uniref:AAA family ATPase n=1 Tax=Billgrantia saliphila TaxID=1848458 RepID=UPI000CE54CC3|nr:AAA family ATPase [Halomonas saliphila]
MKKRVVFTGGPGSGKTTVIDCLREQGYRCTNEVGRKKIQEQVDKGGNALPWWDKVAFRDEMVREEIENFRRHIDAEEFVFFDRGIIDAYGYSELEGIPISDELLEYCSVLEYSSQVFIFPPWESIFLNDAERKQNFSEAIATYQAMIGAYKKFGYSLVEVPKASVLERVNFVLASVN